MHKIYELAQLKFWIDVFIITPKPQKIERILNNIIADYINYKN